MFLMLVLRVTTVDVFFHSDVHQLRVVGSLPHYSQVSYIHTVGSLGFLVAINSSTLGGADNGITKK